MRWRRYSSIRVVLAFAAVGLVSAPLACGGNTRPPVQTKKEPTASWADVFDDTPDLYVVLRPQAIKRDQVYGAFFKAILRAAEARGIARGDTMVRAADGAEEIIVGLNRGVDAALVLRGVPANLDPEKILDPAGQPLFRAVDTRAKVVEYELFDPKSADAGGLFVLPGRTWVGVLGDTRERARQAFATPMNRPIPKVADEALIAVRIGGPLVHALDRHPNFGVLSKKLSSATFSLERGKGGLVVGLRYEDESATAWAEMQAKRLIEDLSKEPSFAWLKSAKVAYEGMTVFVRVDVPPRLLEELPNATGETLGL